MEFFKRLFQGRLNRSDFFIRGVFADILLKVLEFIGHDLLKIHHPNKLALIIMIIMFTYVFIYNLSIAIKRLHDFGKSGYWSLLLFIPLVEAVMMIYLFFKKGDAGMNKYGNSPHKKGI